MDNDTEEILTIVRKRLCQMSILRYQQLDGMQTTLPFGVRKIDAFRTLTTESLAVFMPFRVQEVYDSHGIYYGNNVISGNMIIADRRKLLNGNSFILGVSGGGKSFMAKHEVVNLILSTDADIIILDPEREYSALVRAIGMLVILDSILNSITRNRQKGKHTYIFIDEIYLLFMHEYSAQFLFKLWKRVRKYGAFCTGITQNVQDLLQSYTARTMLSNSEFIIMLNQAASDRIELAKLLNISNEQLSYITNVEAGHGLLKIGSSLVPFENSFPKDTELYRLMSTRPDEKVFGEDPSSDRGGSDALDGKRLPPGSNTDADTDEKAEFMKKIQEVAEKSEDFGELVRKYMGQNE